ncbi:MAG: YraN family protein [Candidatus Sumerlaeota bacterium]
MMRRSIYVPLWPLEPYDKSWHVHRLGIWGERAVARRLWFDGFRIIAHRWESQNRSDIDLVAAKNDLLLFCEVKVRSSESEDVWLQVVDDKRLENLKDAASAYLLETHQNRVNIQFNAYLVRPDTAAPRAPKIRVNSAYLNPAIIPGWRGISAAAFRHAWQ